VLPGVDEKEKNSVQLSTQPSLGRLRWDCRRGMLELDIVLARFMEQNFERLTPLEIEAFKGLLAYSDPDLWGLIQSDETGVDDNVRKVLLLLRQY
jgi:antitoxin CptB